MNWAEYKRLCDQPQVMSRHLLVSTAEIVEACGEQELGSRLRRACSRAPIERPPDHKGDSRSHMFHTTMSRAEVDRIVNLLEGSEVSGTGAMCAAWREHRAAL